MRATMKSRAIWFLANFHLSIASLNLAQARLSSLNYDFVWAEWLNLQNASAFSAPSLQHIRQDCIPTTKQSFYYSESLITKSLNIELLCISKQKLLRYGNCLRFCCRSLNSRFSLVSHFLNTFHSDSICLCNKKHVLSFLSFLSFL